jgi:predicted protein tyrosine phosphatase
MMPWIENVSLANVKKGLHHDAGVNSMLIQIVDPCVEFPDPKHDFQETHQFEFLDTEIDEDFAITDEQATQLVTLLKRALDRHMNVVIHCHAGICRSGAVCEVGVMMGFSDTEVFRSPNLRVKHLMMKSLGWTYDENELHTTNGYTTESGIIVPPKTVDYTNNNEKVFTLAAARRERRERDNET